MLLALYTPTGYLPTGKGSIHVWLYPDSAAESFPVQLFMLQPSSRAAALSANSRENPATYPPAEALMTFAPAAMKEAKIRLQFITAKFIGKFFAPNALEVKAEPIVGQVP